MYTVHHNEPFSTDQDPGRTAPYPGQIETTPAGRVNRAWSTRAGPVAAFTRPRPPVAINECAFLCSRRGAYFADQANLFESRGTTTRMALESSHPRWPIRYFNFATGGFRQP